MKSWRVFIESLHPSPGTTCHPLPQGARVKPKITSPLQRGQPFPLSPWRRGVGVFDLIPPALRATSFTRTSLRATTRNRTASNFSILRFRIAWKTWFHLPAQSVFLSFRNDVFLFPRLLQERGKKNSSTVHPFIFSTTLYCTTHYSPGIFVVKYSYVQHRLFKYEWELSAF